MVDDDGRTRTGTLWTATTHAITAIIGSGVLALPWSVAQVGWIIGPLALVACAYVTYYTAVLLCDCYRTPDPVKGRRNYTYMDVARSCLGPRHVVFCAVAQYAMLWGSTIGYIIVSSTSMMSVDRSNCFHYKGKNAHCRASGNFYMIIFGLVEVVLSQFPNLEKITLISVVAAIMSIAYSFIALALSISKFASHPSIQGTLFGVQIGGESGVSASTKVWHSFQALGNIAFAYTYSMLLIEIQDLRTDIINLIVGTFYKDTLKSPPAENQTMKKASLYGIGVTAIFYVSLGCVGYAAFGNDAPGNILTGFYEPFWLVDIANVAVVIHLLGAFQVYAQPIYAKYEEWLARKWPDSTFFHKVYAIPVLFSDSYFFRFTLCKLILRSLFVALTTGIAMLLPFFNAILSLIGSIAFWPLTVYFPVTIYISQAQIKRGTRKWVMLQGLSAVSLVVSLLAAVGSIADIGQKLELVKLVKENSEFIAVL